MDYVFRFCWMLSDITDKKIIIYFLIINFVSFKLTYYANILQVNSITVRPDFTPKLVHELAFRTPKFYIAPYGKINHRLVRVGKKSLIN